MPEPELNDRYQRALIWNKTGEDRYGETLRDDPVEHMVRWEQKRVEMKDEDGNPLVLDGFLHVVTDIPVGSTVWVAPDSTYSALDQWYGTGSSTADDEKEIMLVETKNYTPDLRNRVVRRTLGMRRYKATLPDAG